MNQSPIKEMKTRAVIEGKFHSAENHHLQSQSTHSDRDVVESSYAFITIKGK